MQNFKPLIPTLDVTERPAPARVPRWKPASSCAAPKVARIPVKIIPTTELPKKPDWIRVRIPVSPEVDRIKAHTAQLDCTACAKKHRA